jgi:universal stress protein A
MAIYKNILLAVDLRVTHDVYTLSRAVQLAKDSNAALGIIHVVEPLNTYGEIRTQTILDLEKKNESDAKSAFRDLVSGFDVGDDQLILEIGSAKKVIIEVAKKLNCDLIIVGAHSKTGLNILLGSTANAVINHAHCDVLTVRTVE